MMLPPAFEALQGLCQGRTPCSRSAMIFEVTRL
jgi:hypothetical protein